LFSPLPNGCQCDQRLFVAFPALLPFQKVPSHASDCLSSSSSWVQTCSQTFRRDDSGFVHLLIPHLRRVLDSDETTCWKLLAQQPSHTPNIYLLEILLCTIDSYSSNGLDCVLCIYTILAGHVNLTNECCWTPGVGYFVYVPSAYQTCYSVINIFITNKSPFFNTNLSP